MKKNNICTLIISLVFTCLFVFLAAPLYIDTNSINHIVESAWKNETARIDIHNMGNDNSNAVKILSQTEHNNPQWCNGCSVLSIPLKTEWKDYVIKFSAIGDGKIRISLKGPDKRDENNNRYPVLVDYSNFTVNGKNVFDKTSVLYHDKAYSYDFSAKDGDIIEFSVQARKHHLRLSDLSQIDIDYMLLFSVVILAFLFSYKLLSYMAKFKIIENSSRIDIVFIVVFAGLLFVPMSHISNAEKSVQENRTLTKFPSFIRNNNFGKQFDSWFSDRFAGRENVISIYNKTKYDLIRKYYVTPRGCVNKKTKWLGNCGYNRRLFSDQELAKASRSTKKLLNFANKNNIKVYFIIAPSQGSVYGKNIVPWYVNGNEHEQIYQMADYLKKNNDVDIIYPYKEILDASKDEFMFFKTDTHWTDAAAFIAYNIVMEKVKEDFNDINISTDDDFEKVFSNKVKVQQEHGFHNGRNYSVLGLDDERFFNVKYKYYMHKDRDKLKQTRFGYPEKNYTIRHFDYGKGKYNLTLFGDSFGENLEPIIPYSFNKTLRIYTYVPSVDLLAQNANIQRFENDILKNNTNVLIICFSMIDRLMYLYKD